ALLAIHLASPTGDMIGSAGWSAMVRIMNWLADNWDQPEEGIWETRGGRRPFVYGRLMCWVAVDRPIRFAHGSGRPAGLDEWLRARDAIYQQIMDKGWSQERKAFVQSEGGTVLDASVLMMPITGFAASRDPQWLSTSDAVQHELVSDSLVYRYDPSASPD